MRIAIQGYEGCFHQMAARAFFGESVEVIPCISFRELIAVASDRDNSDGGIMAIENSIAGSILPNYYLLKKSNLKVQGEIFLQIRQNLLVNPGVELGDIREVHSHPMAIQQCLDYLDQFNWKLIESEDTALSAKRIHQHKSRHSAAIAGRLAADLYGLDILAPDIHTLKHNVTRFLIIGHDRGGALHDRVDKASVSFNADHTRGSLARILSVIAEGGINLSKLQSFPIPGSDFNYSFHADMEFEQINEFTKVYDQMAGLTSELRLYGLYRKGQAM